MRDSSGRIISQNDDASGNLNAEITALLPSTDRYTIEIATFDNYADNVESNYRLDLTLEYRPSVTAPTSDNQLLVYGSHIVDILDPITPETSETINWYFVGQAGDRIDVNLQFPPNDQPLRLFLADGVGNRYQQGERIQDRAVIRDFELPDASSF